MSYTGPTPTFAENDKFDGTNWASWQRLVCLAANQRGAMGYLEGFIKCPVRARNTSVPSKPSVAPAPVTVTETPWSSTSPSIEEWTNRDIWTIHQRCHRTGNQHRWNCSRSLAVIH